ncbi:MAG: TPM domain-containing protein [Muribaculaceae bacterium]|nr:TPM domain-containing protein [Roseburia sp.]MCM1492100.1 TPM domain-containing protein [Muribaculaceae bacterium]
MRKKHVSLKNIFQLAAALLVLLLSVTPAHAIVQDTNDSTGYTLLIDDSAGYFSDSETRSLQTLMEEITEYCNVAVVTTTDHDGYNTEDFAGTYFENCFGSHTSGTLFVIDRHLDEIFLYSDGDARKTITDSKAYSITDNTYIYATSSRDYDYYTCSYKTMEQVLALLNGRRIAEPMKYICSALLAIILALLINYIIVMCLSRAKKPDVQQVLSGTYTAFHVTDTNVRFMHQTRTYSPQSSGGGGHGGGGGGGGGGHSGGGGGHSI